jgi:signal transduction histidine kinase
MQNPFKGSFQIDFYTNQSTIKWIILGVAVIIGLGSIIYTDRLVDELKARERDNIDLWARSIEFSSRGDISGNDPALNFLTNNIIAPENTIPVILVDSLTSQILLTRNVKSEDESVQLKILEKMKKENSPFRILVRNGTKGQITDIQYVYYRNSYLLRQLGAYPFVQLSVIGIFAFIAYLAFNYSRKAEQNRVWVGLAKETAHQLGTPLSSLMAWLEYIKTLPEMEGRKDITDELAKDVERLEMITARFSSIGSLPVLKEQDLAEAMQECIDYLKPRVSSKVSFALHAPEDKIVAQLNKPLFIWVVENIVKNGIDAMSGIGEIVVNIGQSSTNEVFVDISDNGKGIKGNLSDVFKPGYTTKKRGWGLGLALAKRIIENYHQGRVFVKSSQVDVGTTFRITLPV